MPRDVDALITELLARPVTAPRSCAREHRTVRDCPRRMRSACAPTSSRRSRRAASPTTRSTSSRRNCGRAPAPSCSPAPRGPCAAWARMPEGSGRSSCGTRQTASRPRTSTCGGSPASSRRPGCGQFAASCSTFSAEFVKRPRGRPRRGVEAPAIELDRETLRHVRIEDQSGAKATMAELLAGRDTILAFFYTRCMNPARCSLTITRLAGLARSDRTIAPSSR